MNRRSHSVQRYPRARRLAIAAWHLMSFLALIQLLFIGVFVVASNDEFHWSLRLALVGLALAGPIPKLEIQRARDAFREVSE